MALHYNLVFAILVVELALFTIIVLPIPSKIRSPLLTSISLPMRSVQVQVAVKTILFFVLILFVDAFNRSKSIEASLSNELNAPNRTEIQAKRFYAQRNVYLTGFTLFFTLIVNRTYLLTSQLLEIKKTTRSGALSSKDADEIKAKHIEKLKTDLKEKDEELKNLKLKAEQLTKEYSELK